MDTKNWIEARLVCERRAWIHGMLRKYFRCWNRTFGDLRNTETASEQPWAPADRTTPTRSHSSLSPSSHAAKLRNEDEASLDYRQPVARWSETMMTYRKPGRGLPQKVESFQWLPFSIQTIRQTIGFSMNPSYD
jgi:hypothetical protein